MPKRSSTRVKALQPNCAATDCARVALASTTATSCTPCCCFCNSWYTRAWLRPNEPTPTTAMRIALSLVKLLIFSDAAPCRKGYDLHSDQKFCCRFEGRSSTSLAGGGFGNG